MINLYSRSFRRSLWTLALLLIGTAIPSFAQIFQPEAVHMPGTWNGWANRPAAGSALRGTTTDDGVSGGINLVSGPLAASTRRWQTTIHAAASGGDVVGGTHTWVFASGGGNPWANTWKGVVPVVMNTLQNYTHNSGADNSITVANDTWYTVNYRDAGYTGTSAIFMATSAAPVSITNVAQTPVAGSVTPADAVDLTITLSAAKSAQENVFVRYSTNSFANSSFVQATGSGTTYTAQIPAQPDGSIVNYYAFTSTVALATITGAPANTDMYTLRFKNAGGTAAYTYTSAAAAPVNITFRVNMSNETVGGGGVNLAGSWNSFSTTADPMTHIGGGIYEATVALPQSATVEYKFVNGTSFETVPSACDNASGNREYMVGTADATVATVCYRQCGACPPKHDITVRVNTANITVDAAGMFLAGSFNGFSNMAMTQMGSTSIWEATVSVPEGDVIQYKFKNGTGGWENNIGAPCGNGSNRTYTVGTADDTVGVACFNQCVNCTVLRSVTFRVDLGTTPANSNGVHIVGSFQTPAWQPGATAMTQVGSTSVYTYTTTIAEGTSIQYKFVNGNSWGQDETSIPAGCNTSGNRTYTVPVSNQSSPPAITLPTVCFNSCSACPQSYPVTFTVDLGSVTPGANVYVAGTFNGWNATANVLTNIPSTTRYTATFNVLAGTMQYKFINGSNWESVPSVCAVGGNRGATVSGATTLPTVCLDRCISCDATNVWTGSGDTNFNNGNNWTAGVVPNGCDFNVQVNNTTNKPALSSGTASVGNLTFQNGALLTVSTGATLNLCGNMSGAGNIVGGGNLTVSGSGPKSINIGTGKANFQDISVTMTAPSTWTIASGSIYARGTVTLNGNSTIAITGGNLVLESTSSSTARLAPMPAGAAITGGLTMERKLPATTGWYFVTAPLTSSATISQWSELPARVLPANNANVVYYTENDTSRVESASGATVFTTGWRPAPSLSSPINPSNNPRGYRVYQNAAFIASGGKLSAKGTPMVGDVTAPFTFTPTAPGGYDGGGWNLLGNPYPSEIDWNAVKFDPANTSAPSGNAINVYNGATKVYASWTATSATTGVGTNGGSRYIASSQAFFVKATAAGSLTFKESHKDASNGNTFMRTEDPANTLRIAAQGNGYSDEAVLLFMEGANRGADQFDAVKMDGEEINISALPAAGLNHSISVLPLMNGRQEMPLRFVASSAGSFTLGFSGLSTFANGTRMWLRDNYNGALTQVTEGAAYSFSVSADPASKGNSRFTLVMQPDGVTGTVKATAEPMVSVWPVPASASSKINVRVARMGAGKGVITLADAAGRVVSVQAASLAQEGTTLQVNLAGLPKGVYTLKAAGSEAALTRQIVVE